MSCPRTAGSDYQGFTSHWKTPRFILGEMWLGAIDADMTGILTFAFGSPTNAYRSNYFIPRSKRE